MLPFVPLLQAVLESLLKAVQSQQPEERGGIFQEGRSFPLQSAGDLPSLFSAGGSSPWPAERNSGRSQMGFQSVFSAGDGELHQLKRRRESSRMEAGELRGKLKGRWKVAEQQWGASK